MKVNISGTIGKDKRADSGLDDIGDKMNVNRLVRVAVVGIIEYHGHHEVVGQPESITIRFAAIEPLSGKDDTTARHLLDKARRGRGVGSTELTLFDDLPDPGQGPWPGDPGYKAPSDAVGDPFRAPEDGDKGTLDDAAYKLAKGRVTDIAAELDNLTGAATADAPADKPTRARRAKAAESGEQSADKPKRRSRALASVPSGDDAA